MKKAIIILSLLFVSSFNALQAATDPKPVTESQKIREKIIELLGVPQIEFEEELIENTIHFMITQKGTVIVLDVKTKNEVMEKYIKDRLNYKSCGSDLTKMRFYSFTYKVKKPEA
ncbi:hypothetical protein [Leeuwenhoekiella parthenopeia]|uniref:Uncharacterized protein n=1 Tax=Leeuwenhoekiella parthenopeia TaxID=2890320 RepID=A0ABS8GSE4_9FLAO|nr:hypothetical protein [Leeuwenhoekiella parthenopeia]MCC4212916.1 hypothetical protein [Leeuwenhoekiella parthenopeia]